MAGLKLELLLTDTSYEPIKFKRIQVYITNSLKEHKPDTSWLSTEANEANGIKHNAAVIDNSPYAVSSTNEGEWVQGLIADYKKDLNRFNIRPLSNDYIKFIRYGQYYIEKTVRVF